MLGHWLTENVGDLDSDIFGFVYLITNLESGRKYLGKKRLKFTRRKKVAGRKNRKTIIKESDWKEYTGSCNALNEDIARLGKDKFKFEILRWCRSKGECSYWETKLIFENDALLDNNYYNDWVSCKIHSSHIKKNGVKNDV